MDDKQNISLWVGNQLFKLSVPLSEEKLYRDAAEQIKNTLNKYRRDYPDFPAERIMAMATLEISFLYITVKDSNDTQPFTDKIKEWEKELERHAKSEGE